MVLDPEERVQISLTLAGRAELSAAECSGGSGMFPAALFTRARGPGDITRYHKRCCFCRCSAGAPALLQALPAWSCSGVPTMTPKWGYVPLSQVFSVLDSAGLAQQPLGRFQVELGAGHPFLLSSSLSCPTLCPLQPFLLSSSSSSPALPPVQAQP